MNFKIFRQMGYELFDNAQIGTVIGVFLIIFLFAYPVYAVIVTFFGSSPYCEVYENMVVGKSALSRRTPNTPMQKFEISYSEITNVTEAGKRLILYTQYANYEVLALKNCAEAVRIIRERIQENKE